MYREVMRACPGCTSPMQPAVLRVGHGEVVTIDICGACGAGFLDYFAGELGSIARAIGSLHSYCTSSVAAAYSHDPACPDCADDLNLLPYMDDGPLIYRCDACLSAFATAHQLRLLAEFQHTRKAALTIIRAVCERLGVI